MSTKLQSNNAFTAGPLSSTDALVNASEREVLIKYFPQGVVAFDVETTGISPLVDKIVELSAYKITPDGDFTFDALANPEIKMSAEIIAIHGITDEMVSEAPAIGSVLNSFIEFIGDLPLLAHNARFDVGFLLFNTHQLNLQTSNNSVHCTLKFSRASLPGLPSYKLSALSEHFAITHSRAHRALDDAMACLILMGKGLQQIKNQESKAYKDSRLYCLSDFARSISPELPEHLLILRKKIKFSHVVLMKYAGGSLKNKWRPIRPVSLLPMPEGNILYAHCLHSNIYKSFSLSKIREVKEANEEEIQEVLKELKLKK